MAAAVATAAMADRADFGVLDAVLGEILGGRVTWPIDFHEASHLPMFTSCVDVVLDVIFDVSWTSENRTSITSDTEETTRLVRALSANCSFFSANLVLRFIC